MNTSSEPQKQPKLGATNLAQYNNDYDKPWTLEATNTRCYNHGLV